MRSELERLAVDWDHGPAGRVLPAARADDWLTLTTGRTDHDETSARSSVSSSRPAERSPYEIRCRLRRSVRRLRLTVAGLVGFLVLALVATVHRGPAEPA